MVRSYDLVSPVTRKFLLLQWLIIDAAAALHSSAWLVAHLGRPVNALGSRMNIPRVNTQTTIQNLRLVDTPRMSISRLFACWERSIRTIPVLVKWIMFLQINTHATSNWASQDLCIFREGRETSFIIFHKTNNYILILPFLFFFRFHLFAGNSEGMLNLNEIW